MTGSVMKIFPMGVLVGFLLWSVSPGAQQRPTLQIVVDNLSQDAAPCGIDKSSLESIASLTLRNNGVQGTASETNPILYIQPSIQTEMYGGRAIGCSAALLVQILFIGPAPTSKFKAKRSVVFYELCKSGEYAAGPIASFSKQISDALEQEIKLCLGKLDY